jgi:predicted  nucleic acid-binding Zn-ribbon protein
MDKQREMTFRRRALVVAFVVLLPFVLPACSKSKPSTCEAAQNLNDAVSTLFSPSTLAKGTDAVKKQAQQVRSDMADLHKAAGTDLNPELSDFQEAVKALRDTLTSGSPSKDEIKQDVDNIKTAWTALKDKVSKVKTDCNV